MIVKTKKYKLEPSTYIKMAMFNVLREQWWVWFIPFGIMLIPIVYTPALWWCFGVALTAIIGYLLFWGAQFAGVTQMEQSKILFEKLSYEINSQQVMIKIDAKRGMPITWDKVLKATKQKDAFLFIINKAQMIYLPFKVFKNENEIKFVETILKRKSLL